MLQIIIGYVFFKAVKILCRVVCKIILQFDVNEINFYKKKVHK